ncbi:hypothetical protein N7462_003103 [Penicillium macrosclerotiorum]|uniref:uncharacterized protein n=1 Tax=Penicillium macrosclerotiorum TaxID=303699 RepID=UPI002548262D|nr:uncharacterized protein N7462_003103 [Penicillium macrosclerotiorum]KAJ5688711.1 hypothetical protein N7462_003103 [Penicillium macrosclerotiorum]
MAAADVHRLHRPQDFEGQKIFFYKNHPIRFVTVVGLIVARSEVPRRTILTLDDSTGATLDIAFLHATPTNPAPNPLPIAHTQVPDPDTHPSTRHVSATDGTALDISRLHPGTMVQVKGTLSLFRATMQLHAERVKFVPDTNAEMVFVDARLRFLLEVLRTPWELGEEEVARLRGEAERGGAERERAVAREKRRAEREARDAARIRRRYEREEKVRAEEAVVCGEDGARVMRDIRWGRRGGKMS